MMEDNANTCTISDSFFEGITNDYELNNGEQYFKIQEMEVYHTLFN